MDYEEKSLSRRNVSISIDAMHLSVLQSEIVALASILQIEGSPGYRADLIRGMKENLKKQKEIAASRGAFDYDLGKVL